VYIPDEISSLAPDLVRFWSAMVEKLRLNRHKGKWEGLNLDSAFELMEGEVAELEQAIHDGSFAAILFEGADVANFALIVTSCALNHVTTTNTPPGK
jgi:hypothetical protein